MGRSEDFAPSLAYELVGAIFSSALGIGEAGITVHDAGFLRLVFFT